jgi:hypothetical protein
MAGGQRVLRSATHDADEAPHRGITGQDPESHRDDSDRDDMTPTSVPSPSSHTVSASEPAPILLPQQRRLGSEEPVAKDLQTSVTQLLQALNEAELAGAPATEIVIRQRQFERAVETLQRTQGGNASGSTRPAFDEAGRIMRVLNNVQPKPKLGSDGKPPSPQQVDQWVKDVDTAFQYAQVLSDSVTRTHWIMGTIHYGTHRELIQQRINEGSIRTWADLRAEEERLVQDPVFTRYENYQKFFNFKWKDDDSVNTFMMKLNKAESLLPRNFAKFDDGTEDHEFKIAFVWSKTPAHLRKEIQRNGALENLKEWSEFERALRNAETAAEPPNQPPKDNQHSKGKRGPSSPPRSRYKRQHSRGTTPAQGEPGKPPGNSQNRPLPNQNRWNSQGNNQPGGDGNQKSHWKNRNPKGDNQHQHGSGKGKP